VRIERLLAAGASIKGTARKFEIDHHALRRHWINHVSAETRAGYIAGAGATKDQLEEIVADESLALIDHYRIVRGSLYKGFGVASEVSCGLTRDLAARGPPVRTTTRHPRCRNSIGSNSPAGAAESHHRPCVGPLIESFLRGVSGRMNSQKRSPYRDLN